MVSLTKPKVYQPGLLRDHADQIHCE